MQYQLAHQDVFEPAMAAAFPNYYSLTGHRVGAPEVTVALEQTPSGFNAMVLEGVRSIYIDQFPAPGATPDTVIVYEGGVPDAGGNGCHCGADEGVGLGLNGIVPFAAPVGSNCGGTAIRKFRLALASAAEFTNGTGGQPATMAALMTIVNRLNLIYVRDLAVQFTLVTDSSIIFTNPSTDPFTTNSIGPELDASFATLNGAPFGVAGYDVGMTIGGYGGGLAQRPAICFNFNASNGKGRGVAGRGTNVAVNDRFINIVAHELGHMFGADHTFTGDFDGAGTVDNCTAGAFGAIAAYEPGSGTTIMSYGNGICGDDDIQGKNDLYFHWYSLQEMNQTISAVGCYTTCPATNTVPTVSWDACPVPPMTPFELEGTGSDADGDALTYVWEQADHHPFQYDLTTTPDNGAIPLYRSYPPSSSPTRSFPSTSGVISGTLPLGETWHTVNRDLTFALTVRDGKGGTCTYTNTVTVSGGTTFEVTAPSGGTSECEVDITWNVAGTTAPPFNEANVNIFLSTDNGLTFPFQLALGTANDGTETVILPDLTIGNARIRVEAANGCFYNISDAFAITPCTTNIFTVKSQTFDDTKECSNNANGSIDPGEQEIEVFFEIGNTNMIIDANNVTLCISSLSPTATITPATAVTLAGQMLMGECVTQPTPFILNLDASHPCGEPILYELLVKSDEGNSVLLGKLQTGTVNTYSFNYSGITLLDLSGANATSIAIPAGLMVGTLTDVNVTFGGNSCSPNSDTIGNGLNQISPTALEILLVSPAGITSTLNSPATLTNLVLNSANFCNTVFDDSAVANLPAAYPNVGIAPYTGSWIPDQLLSVHNGTDPNGTWFITFQNSYNLTGFQSTGDVRDVTLTFTTLECEEIGTDGSKDIAIFGTTTNATVECADSISYDLLITNLTACNASDIVITSVFPSCLSVIILPDACSTSVPGQLVCSLDLTNNASTNLFITLLIDECCSQTTITNLFTATLSGESNLMDNLSAPTVSYTPDGSAPTFGTCGPANSDLGCLPDFSSIPTEAAILASAMDDCAVVSSWVITGMVADACMTIMTQTFYAVDNCANTGTCERVITWMTDTNAPTFTCNTNIQDLGCSPVTVPDSALVLATAADDCGVMTTDVSELQETNGCVITLTRTYTADDACANTGTCIEVFTWTDSPTVPSFSMCPGNMDLGVDPPAADFPDVAAVLASASDDCIISTSFVEIVTITNGCDMIMTQNYVAVDDCGQTGTCVAVISWTGDMAPPTFTCNVSTQDLGCSPVIVPDSAIVLATATDACGVVTSFVSETFMTNNCSIILTRDYFALDAANNTGTCTEVFTWTDSPAVPSFSMCPGNMDLGVDPPAADFPDIAAVLASASDDCTISTSFVDVVTVTNGCDMVMTQSYVAVDDCGQTGTCVAVIFWSADNTPPTFTCNINTQDLGCAPVIIPDGNLVLATATDVCGVVTSEFIDTYFTNGCFITLFRDHFATDAAGNTGTCFETFSWIESADTPTFGACPGNLDLGVNPVAADFPDMNAVLASAMDDCLISTSYVDIVAVTNACDITMTQTYFAVDTCGQTGTCVAVITWSEDDGPPVFTLCSTNEDFLGCNPDLLPPASLVLASAMDGCAIISTSVIETLTTNINCEVSLSRDYIAVDASGVTGTCFEAYAWLIPGDEPIFTNCPGNIVLGPNPQPSDFPNENTVLASAYDACGVVTAFVETVVMSNGCDTVMSQTYFAVDNCGQTGTCVSVITWPEDSEPPSFTCNTSTQDLGCAPVTIPDVSIVLATATDTCSSVTSEVFETEMTNGCTVILEREYFAYDASGNTGTCYETFTWTIDDAAPSFGFCPSNAFIGFNPVAADFLDPSNVLASAMDDCGVVTSYVETVTSSNGCFYSMSQIFYAVDACGLTGTCEVVTDWAIDITPPTFVCNTNVQDLGCAPVTLPDPSNVLNTVSDPCDWASADHFDFYSTNGCTVQVDRLFAAVDFGGNTGICTEVYTWTVNDGPPVFGFCPSNMTLGVNPMPSEFPDTAVVLGSVTDSCGIATSYVSEVAVTNGCAVTMTQTYYAIDTCGLTGTCTTVIDWSQNDGPPVFVGCNTSVQFLGCTPTNFPSAEAVFATVTDACTISSTSVVETVFTNSTCEIFMNREYIAVDADGNTGYCYEIYSWIGANDPPVFTNCSPYTFLGYNPAPANFPDTNAVLNSATDDCGIELTYVESITTTNGCRLSMTQFFHAIDMCFNETVCTSVVEWVVDNEPPTFTCNTNQQSLLCLPASLPSADLVLTSAVDNCGVMTTMVSEAYTTNGCAVSLTREYTAIDFAGNIGFCFESFDWIADNTVPFFTNCPASLDLGYNPSSNDFPDTTITLATAFDSCGIMTAYVDVVETNTGCNWMQTRTFNVIDVCGRIGLCEQVIAWTEDVTPPVIPCNTNVQNLGCNPTNLPSLISVTDFISDDCVLADVVVEDVAVTNGCEVLHTRTFYAIDLASNESICVETYLYTVDASAPGFTNCVAEINLGCNPLPSDFPTNLPAVIEACDYVLNMNTVELTNGCERIIIQTFEAVDFCGNTGVCEQIITWTINTNAPAFGDCPANIDLGCNPTSIPGADSNVFSSTTGDCGISIFDVFEKVTTNGCMRELTRSYLASDFCGNTSICEQVITWTIDTTLPTMTACLYNTNLGCNATVPAPATIACATDDCGIMEFGFTDRYMTNGCLVILTREYLIADFCGNTQLVADVMTWTSDTAPPLIPCNTNVIDLGTVPVSIPSEAVVLSNITDTCGLDSIQVITNQSQVGDIFFLERLYTASDTCGNTSTCLERFTWREFSGPFLVDCPPAIIELGCNPQIIPDVGSIAASNLSACPITGTNVTDTLSQVDCDVTIQRLITFTGECGTQTCEQVITWREDIRAPTFTYVPTSTNGCELSLAVADTGGDATAMACSSVTVSRVDSIVTNIMHITLTRTWVAEDQCGNVATAEQVIASAFSGMAVFASVPTNVIGCNIATDIATHGAATAMTSSCGTSVVSSVTITNQVDCRLEVIRIWTVQNAVSSLTATQSIVSIQDTEPPVMSLPADMSGCSVTNVGTATATDNCGTPSISMSDSVQTSACMQVILRTYTATDDCGNATSAVQRIEIFTDATPPTLNTPGFVQGCNISADPIDTGFATVSDSCSSGTVTFVDLVTSNGCITRISRIWTGVDACGNSTVSTQLIESIQGVPPALNCPAGQTVLPNEFGQYIVPDFTGLAIPGVDCGTGIELNITQSPAPGTVFGTNYPAGASVTLSAEDACGNTVDCTIALTNAAVIGNFVWLDLNGNGLQDLGEPGLSGVTVHCLDSLLNIIGTTLTDATGRYEFHISGLNPGVAVPRVAYGLPGSMYAVSFDFSSSPTYLPTLQNAAGVAINSEVDQVTGQTALFLVEAGDVILTKDIGLYEVVTIDGFIWYDMNNDGSPSNENLSVTGFNNIDLQLHTIVGGVTVATMTVTTTMRPGTSDNGYYVFENLPPGEYQLEVDIDQILAMNPMFQPGASLTAIQTFTVESGQGSSLTFDNLPFVLQGTSIDGVSIDQSDTSISWSPESEGDTLGYNVRNLSNGQTVNAELILADGSEQYSVDISDAPDAQYAIEEISSSLESTVHPVQPRIEERDAQPVEGQAQMILATEIPMVIQTQSGFANYMVSGFTSAPEVLDITDPDQTIRLIPAVITSESGTAVYFSAEANRKILIK